SAGPPALRRESDDPATVPLRDHRSSRGAAKEERRFQIDVVLEIPVVLGDLVQGASPAQNSCEVSEDVYIHVLAAVPLDEAVVARDEAEVGRDSEVSPPGQPGDELVQLCLIEIDRHHAGAGGVEGAGDGPTDPA